MPNDEKDDDMYYIRLEKLKNMPDNSSFNMATFAIIGPNGNYLANIDDVTCRVDSDGHNPTYKRNLKFPKSTIEPGTSNYIYGELRVIDDGQSDFPSTLYGCIILEFDGS